MKTEIVIRTANIEEVVQLTRCLPEFEQPYRQEEYHKRLSHTPHLLLVAEADGKVVGCKVGYEREQDGSFYSWIGGVLPAYRRQGIARLLARAQEDWARSQGYRRIRFKTRNCHRNMLRFALSNGFYLTAVEPRDDWQQTRIWLQKEL
ncbi:MAG: GNAT family N-acetyltransferase [Bacteroidetes bacterium]|nr:MAG: GNAT family N-acetyltransferase [Bacteroidota bacterium]